MNMHFLNILHFKDLTMLGRNSIKKINCQINVTNINNSNFPGLTAAASEFRLLISWSDSSYDWVLVLVLGHTIKVNGTDANKSSPNREFS